MVSVFVQLNDLLNDLRLRDVISVGALIVAFFSLVITLRDKKRQQNESVIRALQGEKESVAYIALQMRNRRLPRSKKYRNEIITSLCLAWILGGSDRARSSLLAALTKANKARPDEVEAIRQDIYKQLEDYRDRILLDDEWKRTAKGDGEKAVENYQIRLQKLGKALGHTVAQDGGDPEQMQPGTEKPPA